MRASRYDKLDAHMTTPSLYTVSAVASLGGPGDTRISVIFCG